MKKYRMKSTWNAYNVENIRNNIIMKREDLIGIEFSTFNKWKPVQGAKLSSNSFKLSIILLQFLE